MFYVRNCVYQTFIVRAGRARELHPGEVYFPVTGKFRISHCIELLLFGPAPTAAQSHARKFSENPLENVYVRESSGRSGGISENFLALVVNIFAHDEYLRCTVSGRVL